MTLPKEQIDAIRQCLRILAPLHSPTMRETMARNTEEYIQKGKWLPAFELEHIPLLYYPSDSIKAAAMREAMENAYQSGELPGGKLYKRRFTPSQMAAWTDCPLVPANSPLRFWLDDFMQVKPALSPNVSIPDGLKTIVLPSGTTHVPFNEVAHLIAFAIHPETSYDDEPTELTSYDLTKYDLEKDLKKAARFGILPVKNSLTLGAYDSPSGNAFNHVLVTVNDLRSFIADRGIQVVVEATNSQLKEVMNWLNSDHPNSPGYHAEYNKAWGSLESIERIEKEIQELENTTANTYDQREHKTSVLNSLKTDLEIHKSVVAGKSITTLLEQKTKQVSDSTPPKLGELCMLMDVSIWMAKQEVWDTNRRESFLKELMLAANEGKLIVRNPETDISRIPKDALCFTEYTKPKHVNEWLEKDGSNLKWGFKLPDASLILTESPKDRRARWLDWYGKGERGAIQRVYERELDLNPKVDRSFIGKEIKKAKKEKSETKRDGIMYGQLVQDGKRVS